MLLIQVCLVVVELMVQFIAPRDMDFGRNA